jgi:hypothetical protein
MAAPKGNQFWKIAKYQGKPRAYKSADEIWDKAEEYFEWVDKNPIKETKLFGTGLKDDVNLMRPYTQSGLLLYMNIDDNTWRRYGSEDSYQEYWGVVKHINQIIYTQKFEGAAVGLLNPNIIARDLGLVDKQETKTEQNICVTVTPEEVKSIREGLEKKI